MKVLVASIAIACAAGSLYNAKAQEPITRDEVIDMFVGVTGKEKKQWTCRGYSACRALEEARARFTEKYGDLVVESRYRFHGWTVRVPEHLERISLRNPQ